jgi:hypothetical protein
MHEMVLRIAAREADGYPIQFVDLGDDPAVRDAQPPTWDGFLPLQGPANGGLDLDTVATVLRRPGGEPLDPRRMQAAGEYLLQWLTTSDPGDRWLKAVQDAGGGGREHPITTFLEIVPAELRRLPWELLAHGADHLFRNEGHQCVRRATGPANDRAGMSLPVRVLLLVGNPDGDRLYADDEVNDYLCADDELNRIHDAISDRPGLWHLETLSGPTEEEFERAVRDVDPHIFHFIGHATPQHGAAAEPEFLVSPANGPAWSLQYSWLVSLVRHRRLRLVLLHACRTNETFPGEALVEKGAAAVLTVQGDIRSKRAAELGGELYAALARGEEVPAAVAQARGRLVGDWAMLSLAMADPTAVLCPPPGPGTVADHPCDGDGRICYLANRSEEHRRIWGDLDADQPHRRITVVTGPDGAGVTSLLRSCLHTWERRGTPVVYASCANQTALGWLDVLRRVTEAARPLAEGQSLVMKELDCELAILERGPDRLDGDPDSRPSERRKPDSRLSERWKVACGHIVALLWELAGTQPLVLALDQVEQIGPGELFDLFDPIGEHLLRPLVSNDKQQVRLILAGHRTGTLEENRMPWPPKDVNRVDVGLLDRARAERLLKEYGARRGGMRDKAWWSLWHAAAPIYAQMMPNPWRPELLKTFYDDFKRIYYAVSEVGQP